MKVYDISLTISSNLPTWPGDPKVYIQRRLELKKGEPCNLSELRLGSHTGTHVDAPHHFVEKGITVDEIPLEVLIGRVRLFSVCETKRITLDDVERLDLAGVERVIFKTVNSQYWNLPTFKEDYAYITKEAAQFLVERGIRLVGLDYLSVEKHNAPKAEVHHIFLGSGVIIVEGLDLRNVEPGDYELIVAPLKIKGGDGAPARVFLRTLEG